MNSAKPITKFLIIRFSSIGDIVLTSPVMRCIKEQYPHAEVHFLTKANFKSLVEFNPNIDKLWLLKDSTFSLLRELKKEKFDYIIDLHHNLRTMVIKAFLHSSHVYSFNKMNIEKWIYVNIKKKNMHISHVADRYLGALDMVGIKDDQKGIDFYIPPHEHIAIDSLPAEFQRGYIAMIIGAKFATKRLPMEKIKEICQNAQYPILLIGGKEDTDLGKLIEDHVQKKSIKNIAGKYNLLQSASIIQQATCIITNDTGMMHIASAFNKKIISIWGNTTPEIGFAPYRVTESVIVENKSISCRPCSKIGFNACPKGHFNCMNQLDMGEVVKELPILSN